MPSFTEVVELAVFTTSLLLRKAKVALFATPAESFTHTLNNEGSVPEVEIHFPSMCPLAAVVVFIHNETVWFWDQSFEALCGIEIWSFVPSNVAKLLPDTSENVAPETVPWFAP